MAEGDLTSKFAPILKSVGITEKISSVVTNDTGFKGENFGSFTEYITVTFEDEGKKPLNLFVKNRLSNSPHAEMLEEMKVFEKEAEFFQKFIPAAEDLCKKKGVEELMEIYPKCYYGDEKLIIIENLIIEKGYKMYEPMEMLDLEAEKWALMSLAKHHAISHAIITEMGGPEKFFEAHPTLELNPWIMDCMKAQIGPLLENGVRTATNIVEKSGLDGSSKAHDFLKGLQGNMYQFVHDIHKVEPGDRLFLLHGDYNKNNMMFLKDDAGKIKGHKQIDFQVVRYNTVGVDIGYHLFTSAKKEVRRENLKELLEAYLDTLNETGNKLGCPINMTFEELKRNFSRTFKLGFWLMFASSNGGAKIPMHELAVDIKEFSSFADTAAKMEELANKWLDEHPEACEEGGRSILEYLKEYERLCSAQIG